MAGDWLPMRMDLGDDPAVIAIAEATGLDEYAVVGRLHRLWSWANRQLADGNARSVTDSWLDRYIGATGFAAAMIAVGWLKVAKGGLEFPKFDRWNSKGAKRRVLTAERVKRSRNADGNAASVTEALPEKRREEKSNTEDPPTPRRGETATKDDASAVPIPDALNTPEFAAAWSEWLAHRKAKRKPVTARAARLQLDGLAALTVANAVACVRSSIANDYQGIFPEKFQRGPPRSMFPTHDERIMGEIGEALS